METGSKLDLVESPPVYSISPKGWTPEKRKKVVIISVVVIVLSLIAVAAILIGVKMTQDHTEKIFQMSFKNPDGSNSQQTATVNKQESVATFYVTGKNSSSTILYDYTNSLICTRVDSKVCYITKMDKSKIPSLDSISSSFQNMQSTSSISPTSQVSSTYTAQKEAVVDRTVLGTNVNVLCSGVPIYWIQETTAASRALYRYCYYYDCYLVYIGGQPYLYCRYICYYYNI
ncbi:surfactant protein C-like [Ambystoma mexicanum]|uniref:surfactant protein C-like n=1 Tax=Ambystoma mexicanum TaxID=8296 RepID=UPI0037E92729